MTFYEVDGCPRARGPASIHVGARLSARGLSAAISVRAFSLALCAVLGCSSNPKIVVDADSSDTQAGAGGRSAAGAAGAARGMQSGETRAIGGGGGADRPLTAAGQGGMAAVAPTSSKPESTDDDDAGAPDAGTVGPPPITPPPRSTEPADPDATLVPLETADADALQRLAAWNELPKFRSERYEQQSSHDRGQPASAAELALAPLLIAGNRDLDNFICKSADARTGQGLLAYRYDQESCQESYARGVVLARYEGSGRLARFWLTAASLSLAGGKLADEVLRIYVDDNPRPFVQARLADVLSGKAGEIFAPPFGAASEAFVAWYYPVVFGSKLIVTLDRLSTDYYFQTDVLRDPELKSRFAPAARSAARTAATAQLMAANPADGASMLAKESFSLSKDQTRAVTIMGPATVRELRLKAAGPMPAALAGVRIRARWNGADPPAIDLPLLDLFAARRGVFVRGSLALAAATEGGGQTLSLRLPMPFETTAEWTLEQTGEATAQFDLEWLGVDELPDGEFGHLAVQQRELPLPASEIDQVVAEATGRGRYVGMCADLEGRAEASLGLLGSAPLNLLEGDVRATVDGKRALDGTGTEDYPDNAFYFRETPAATPFAQSWHVVNDPAGSPPGGASFCRWQVLGTEVDFQHELRLTHEIAIDDPSIVLLHRTIAFLYLR